MTSPNDPSNDAPHATDSSLQSPEPMMKRPVTSIESSATALTEGDEHTQPGDPNENEEVSADEDLVTEALAKIETIFIDKMNSAMEEVGFYLLETFFDGNPARAQNKKPAKEKSFLRLVKRLHETHAHAPSKSSLYNAVNIALDTRYFESTGFPRYKELGMTHKVYLTRVKDLEIKKEIAEKALNEGLSTREIEARISGTKKGRVRLNLKNLDNTSLRQSLMKKNPKKLRQMEEEAEAKIIDLNNTIEARVKELRRLNREETQAYHSLKEIIKETIKEKSKKKTLTRRKRQKERAENTE